MYSVQSSLVMNPISKFANCVSKEKYLQKLKSNYFFIKKCNIFKVYLNLSKEKRRKRGRERRKKECNKNKMIKILI